MTGILLAALIVAPFQTLASQTCACAGPGDPGFEAGEVWRGDRPLSLPEIAAILAPTLWFSSDEPLLIEGLGPLPDPHPCDPDRREPVVYYQVRSVRLAGERRVTLPEEEDIDFWDKVARLTICYYFYYPEDRGLGGHNHDLEVAEFEVSLMKTQQGCHIVRLLKVRGYAHGLDWYYNELDIEADTRFPLTILVEEGKHASCPDRNADGVYTPGYDVNRRVNDAWGLRDVMGSGFIGTGGFNASMAKPRESEFRVWPSEVPYACRNARNSSFTRSDALRHRYELRRANQVPPCTKMGPEGEKLLAMMNDHKFGPDHQPRQVPGWEIKALGEPLTYTKTWLPPIALRRDRTLGLALTLKPLDLGQFGYVAPRINYIFESNDVSFEGMITPSASQFFSWYITAGAGYEHELFEVMGNKGYFGKPSWNFVSEAGVKFRARVPGKWRILSLGYDFAGVRFGIRNSGFDDFESSRIVFEIGAGIF